MAQEGGIGSAGRAVRGPGLLNSRFFIFGHCGFSFGFAPGVGVDLSSGVDLRVELFDPLYQCLHGNRSLHALSLVQSCQLRNLDYQIP